MYNLAPGNYFCDCFHFIANYILPPIISLLAILNLHFLKLLIVYF